MKGGERELRLFGNKRYSVLKKCREGKKKGRKRKDILYCFRGGSKKERKTLPASLHQYNGCGTCFS